MPNLDIAPTSLTSSITALPFTAGTTLSGSDAFKIPNDGKTVIVLIATNLATATNVTIKTFLTVDGLDVADKVFEVPAAAAATNEYIVGTLDPEVYNNSDGEVEIRIANRRGSFACGAIQS